VLTGFGLLLGFLKLKVGVTLKVGVKVLLYLLAGTP
jgi:hypothetical protein